MGNWNFASIAIALVIFGIFTSVVGRMLWNHRHGKGGCSCGGNCGTCCHCK